MAHRYLGLLIIPCNYIALFSCVPYKGCSSNQGWSRVLCQPQIPAPSGGSPTIPMPTVWSVRTVISLASPWAAESCWPGSIPNHLSYRRLSNLRPSWLSYSQPHEKIESKPVLEARLHYTIFLTWWVSSTTFVPSSFYIWSNFLIDQLHMATKSNQIYALMGALLLWQSAYTSWAAAESRCCPCAHGRSPTDSHGAWAGSLAEH